MSYDPNNPWGDQGQNPGGADPNSPPPPGYGAPPSYGAPPPNYQQYPSQGGYPPPRYPMGIRSPEQQKIYNLAIAGILISLCSFCFLYFLGAVGIILGGIAISKGENKGWIAIVIGGVSILVDIISIAMFGF